MFEHSEVPTHRTSGPRHKIVHADLVGRADVMHAADAQLSTHTDEPIKPHPFSPAGVGALGRSPRHISTAGRVTPAGGMTQKA